MGNAGNPLDSFFQFRINECELVAYPYAATEGR